MRTRPVLALFLTAVPLGAAGACGDGGSATTPRGPVALEDYRVEWARAVCTMFAGCARIGDRDASSQNWIFADRDACSAFWSEVRESDEITRQLATVELGLTTYDGTAARRCFDAMVTLCQSGRETPGCDEIFDGLVPLGGECSSAAQCVGDAFCELGEVCGVCRERIPIGGACDYTGCSVAVAPAHCEQHVCRAITWTEVALGGFCDGLFMPEGEPPPRCVEGTYCHEGDYALGEDSVCRAFVPAGQPCGWGERCEEGADCREQDDNGLGVCTRLTIQGHAGAVCDATHLCNTMARLRCESGRCVSAGDGGLGTRCNASDFSIWPTECREGFVCDAHGDCVAAERECTSSGDCPDGQTCFEGDCFDLGGGELCGD